MHLSSIGSRIGSPGRFSRMRVSVVAAPAVAVAILIAGCGSDDDADAEAEAQQLAITLTGPGDFEAPSSAEAGLAEITFENASDADADAQLVPVEGDRSPEEVIEGFAAARDGNTVPEWLSAGGGVGATEPGSSQSVTQMLEPGTYYVFNTFEADELEQLDSAALPAIEVEGEPSEDGLPEADATVTAFEYSFEAEGLTAGETEILFENSGEEPHHLVAAPLAPGRTIDEVGEWFETEEGQAPVALGPDAPTTTVLGGGRSQLVSFDLEAGSYALICFVADRQGGPPHVVLGMVSEAEVSE